VISIRKSVDDLTRLDELAKREALFSTIFDCYTLAIQSTAHYAVEVDSALTIAFRAHLQTIEEQSRHAVTAEQLRDAQSCFRGELREYRDKSRTQLLKLRKEIEDTTVAMTLFADSVASNGENHELEMKSQLQGLELSAQSNDVQEIRGAIGTAVVGIRCSVDQNRRANQFVIAQLQDEIRSLHREIEEERKTIYTDRASGAWNRAKIDLHLDNLLRQNQPFCLLLVWVRNLKRIENQYPRGIVESTLQALVSRFAGIAGEGAMIGRWTDDQFVAVLDVSPGSAIPLSAEATRKLSGTYVIQEDGLSQKVVLNATSGLIDRAANADSSTFRQKLEQLAVAICGA
jgi:GGDEF domain-containing protein